tara:strand:- start:45 stop:584 length:540 start_codon:yes stop_codon:yes gene_type:complete
MKIFFKEKQNFLTKENNNFIKETLFSKSFPFFFQEGTTTNRPEDAMFTHVVLKRLEETRDLRDPINTDDITYVNTLDILNNFCKKIGEKPNFYTRISYNITIPNKNKTCDFHVDHVYKHKQIIIYLNDSSGNTFIVDEDNKVIKEIPYKLGKGVCFENLRHYQEYPKFGARIALVATFI